MPFTDAHPIDDGEAVRHDRPVSAARVYRPPVRRRGLRLWGTRVVGLLATAALLGVGVASALMVMPAREGDELAALDALEPGSPDTAEGSSRDGKRSSKRRLTRAQRRERARAADVLRDQGYRPLSLSTYEPAHTLRVLVGRGDAGQRAFFFVRGRYVGTDGAIDSYRVRVVRSGERTVTLSYRLYSKDDEPCCPTGGSARVRFRWDGSALKPLTPVPAASLRRR
jgi:hypothetical protein